MSEPIPESIPTSADPRSRRATKKRALTPVSQQSAQVDALFAHSDRPVTIPEPAKERGLAPPPEVVANVQGSSAGAGSGEFHVYKAARRKEYERLRMMDSETKREEADRQFEERRSELKKADDEKTKKNKARREKQKARKDKSKVKGKGANGGESVVAKAGTDGGRDGGNGTESTDMAAKLPASGVTNGRSESDVTKLAGSDGNPKAVEEVGIVIHDDG